MRILWTYLVLQMAVFVPAMAQIQSEAAPTITCYVDEVTAEPPQPILAAVSGKGRQVGATEVLAIYEANVPQEAKPAIETALNIWGNIVSSKVPIRVKITWESLTSTVLAQTSASAVYRDFAEAPYKSIWYPTPLAEALAGRELNSSKEDITIRLNNQLSWSYLTTGERQFNRFDLCTIVLHELAHGLGFTTSFGSNSAGQGTWGQSGYAYAYDVFVYSNRYDEIDRSYKPTKLIDTKIFGNPSAELLTALTNNSCWFDLKPISKNNGYVKLYAPSSFVSGGSISHLDEAVHSAGSVNALMTPNIRQSEIIHAPGPLALQILYRLGWRINYLPVDANVILGETPLTVNDVLLFPNPTSDYVNIAFPNQPTREIAYHLYSMEGKLVESFATNLAGAATYQLNLIGLPTGVYILQLTDEASQTSRRLILR